MNVWIGIGRLTKDVEIKVTQTQKKVTRFTLAVDRPYSQNDETDFITCVAWEKSAEFMEKYLGKGSLIAVEGALQVRSYDDPNTGARVYVSEIIVRRIKALERLQERQPQYGQQPQYQPRQHVPTPAQYMQQAQQPYQQPKPQVQPKDPLLQFDDDDFPF